MRTPTFAVVAVIVLLALAVAFRFRGVTESSTVPSSESSLEVGALSFPAPPIESARASTYTVQPGDTLSGIAASIGTDVGALLRENGLADANAIFVGQELRVSTAVSGEGPAIQVVPNSEVVFGPAYLAWRTEDALAGWQGRLATHVEPVDGVQLTGAEIVDRVVREYSVGPRVLLAFVEAQSGWVTGAGDPALIEYPAGLVDPMRTGLWWQMSWLANQLNQGYYDWASRGSRAMTFEDGTALAGHASLGPGSFAVHRAAARLALPAELEAELAGFDEAYRRLFGDPWERAVSDRVPRFPALRLPWAEDEAWWFTGGPHGGWVEGSAWAALDFVPQGDLRGCFVDPKWILAAADGVVLDGGPGVLLLDLDGDGHRQTGPVLFHLHVATEERVEYGRTVAAGEPLGHPSCEGGRSNATHLHLGRLFDGAWVAAAGRFPFEMGGWRAEGTDAPYDGILRHSDGRTREACECREESVNDVAW